MLRGFSVPFVRPARREGRRGTHLKTATLLTKTPHSQSMRPYPTSLAPMRSVSGMSGRRMLFSWTWKLRRKKAIAERKSA